jgi:hypothetical protein
MLLSFSFHGRIITSVVFNLVPLDKLGALEEKSEENLKTVS